MKKKDTSQQIQIRDRVKELRRVKASDLLPNPKNWRIHPQAQKDALRAVLAEVGFAGAALAFETSAGLQLVDGHLRADIDPEMQIPVLILDINEAEADKLLATYDPISAMAEADAKQLDSLLREIDTGSEELREMLSGLAEDAGILDDDREVQIKPIDTRPPPVMTWALIGIPTVRFGEIAETMERLAAIQDIILETTSNDG